MDMERRTCECGVGEGMPDPPCQEGVVETNGDCGDMPCVEATHDFYPRSVHTRAPNSQGPTQTRVLPRYVATWKRNTEPHPA